MLVEIKVINSTRADGYELAPKLFPFLFRILITMQNFKILGGREVLPPDPHFQTRKYKGFSKFNKGKYL